jgi:hypothetical protein
VVSSDVIFVDLTHLEQPAKTSLLKIYTQIIYVSHDEAYYDAFLSNMDYSPGIYTHRYDSTGTRLFSAGDPLPASLFGNYAALWL